MIYTSYPIPVNFTPTEHPASVTHRKNYSTVYLQKLINFCKIQQQRPVILPLLSCHPLHSWWHPEIEYLSTPNPLTQQVWQSLTDVAFPTPGHVPTPCSPPKRDIFITYQWRHHNNPSDITPIFHQCHLLHLTTVCIIFRYVIKHHHKKDFIWSSF